MLQLLFALIIGASYGLITYSGHKIKEANKHYGPLFTLVPPLTTSLIWLLFWDLPKGGVETVSAIINYWWAFLPLGFIVWIGQYLKMKALFHNNFQSTIILMNLGILFSFFIEYTFNIREISNSMIISFAMMLIAAYITHSGGHISFKITAWYAIFFTLFQAFGRNIEHFLLISGVGIFTIFLLEQSILIPIHISLKGKSIINGIPNLIKDKWAIRTLLLGLFTTPASFFYVKEYGPTSVILSITIGLLIASIFENRFSQHIPNNRLYLSSTIAIMSIVISVLF